MLPTLSLLLHGKTIKRLRCHFQKISNKSSLLFNKQKLLLKYNVNRKDLVYIKEFDDSSSFDIRIARFKFFFYGGEDLRVVGRNVSLAQTGSTNDVFHFLLEKVVDLGYLKHEMVW